MRESQEIQKIILDFAAADKRVLAVLLTGSRADLGIPADRFQDYDIIYVVTHVEGFLEDQGWLSYFGERLILQIPEQMQTRKEKEEEPFLHFLVLFTDGNRIDFSLVPVEQIKNYYIDGPAVLLWDKENLLKDIHLSHEKGHLIKMPDEKDFLDTCNEFWWVSTYVAKGLARDDISYAREMFEIPVRSMFMKMIAWYIGVDTSFSVSFGKSGRFMKNYLPAPLYLEILSTYADGNPENIWNALFRMAALFSMLSKQVANSLGFSYNLDDEQHVRKYLDQVYLQKKEPETSS